MALSGSKRSRSSELYTDNTRQSSVKWRRQSAEHEVKDNDISDSRNHFLENKDTNSESDFSAVELPKSSLQHSGSSAQMDFDYQYDDYSETFVELSRYGFTQADFNDDGTPREHAKAAYERYLQGLLEEIDSFPALDTAMADAKQLSLSTGKENAGSVSHDQGHDFAHPFTRPKPSNFKKDRRDEYIEFTNRVKSTQIYSELANHNLSPQEKNNKIKMDLGRNINTADHKHYFAETPVVQAYAQNFLVNYFNDSANIAIFEKAQREKNRLSGQFNPRCISFVAAKVNGHPICFIAVSVNYPELQENRYLGDLLQSIKNTCVDQQKKGCSYYLAPKASNNYSLFLRSLSEDFTQRDDGGALKGCAEKSYSSLITKTMLNPDAELEIEGVINLDFFPYNPEIDYRRTNKRDVRSFDSIVTKKIDASVKTLSFRSQNHNYIAALKDNCKDCEVNYQSVVSGWMAAKQIGREQRERKRASAATVSSASVASASSTAGLQLTIPSQATFQPVVMSPLPVDFEEFISYTNHNAVPAGVKVPKLKFFPQSEPASRSVDKKDEVIQTAPTRGPKQITLKAGFHQAGSHVLGKSNTKTQHDNQPKPQSSLQNYSKNKSAIFTPRGLAVVKKDDKEKKLEKLISQRLVFTS